MELRSVKGAKEAVVQKVPRLTCGMNLSPVPSLSPSVQVQACSHTCVPTWPKDHTASPYCSDFIRSIETLSNLHMNLISWINMALEAAGFTELSHLLGSLWTFLSANCSGLI